MAIGLIPYMLSCSLAELKLIHINWCGNHNLITAQLAESIYLSLFGIRMCLLTLHAFEHETGFIISGFDLTSVVTSQVTDTELLSLSFWFNLAPVCYAKPQEGLFDIGLCVCVCTRVWLWCKVWCYHLYALTNLCSKGGHKSLILCSLFISSHSIE